MLKKFLITALFWSFSSIVAFANPIEGEWHLSNSCFSLGSSKAYAAVSLKAESKALSFSMIEYSDDQCSSPSVHRETQFEYMLGIDHGSHEDIDFTELHSFMTPLSTEMVDHFNLRNVCGYSDWTLGSPKECDISHRGDQWFSIFKIEGDRLYLGHPSTEGPDGSSHEHRHNLLSSDFFIRKN